MGMCATYLYHSSVKVEEEQFKMDLSVDDVRVEESLVE
jgi:hypothetical protein